MGRQMNAIHCLDAKNATAVGDDGRILRTTDGGNTWTLHIDERTQDLFCVQFISVDTGFAAGRDGTILRTTNAGATWDSRSIPSGFSLLGIDFATNKIGVIVGDIGTIVRTTDAGNTWTEIVTGSQHSYASVHFVNSKVGTIALSGGTVLRTTNAGLTWTPQSVPTEGVLLGVFFTDPNTGIVVGESGIVLRTTDGGSSWSKQFITPEPMFYDVEFVSPTKGFAVGQRGVWYTEDGGITWDHETEASDNLWDISFGDAFTGMAAGNSSLAGVIYRTTVGGIVSVKEVYSAPTCPLADPYPNPAQDITTIRFAVSRQGAVVLDVIDALGNTVAVLVSKDMNVGGYETTLNALQLPLGTYYCRLKHAGTVYRKHFSIVR